MSRSSKKPGSHPGGQRDRILPQHKGRRGGPGDGARQTQVRPNFLPAQQFAAPVKGQKTRPISPGTDGSNPSPSSGESAANSDRARRDPPCMARGTGSSNPVPSSGESLANPGRGGNGKPAGPAPTTERTAQSQCRRSNARGERSSGYLRYCTKAMPISATAEMIARIRPCLEIRTKTLSPQRAMRAARIAK